MREKQTRKTVLRSPDELPADFASADEEDEFWSSHEFGEEFLDKCAPVPDSELPPVRPRTRPTGVRLDDDVLYRLKAVAELKGKGYQSLIKEFIAERLYEEEKREGILPRRR